MGFLAEKLMKQPILLNHHALSDPALSTLAVRLAYQLRAQNRRLSVAESCTGGWISKLLTDIPGSSVWFERGFVTYSNAAKQDLLGVTELLLTRHGAVSEPVVHAMALGAMQNTGVQCSLAVSGIAGPGGGTDHKPVGTICFAWAFVSKIGTPATVTTATEQWSGTRDTIRRYAVAWALTGLISLLEEADQLAML
jgi:nicotinamide-nucleotide amidase